MHETKAIDANLYGADSVAVQTSQKHNTEQLIKSIALSEGLGYATVGRDRKIRDANHTFLKFLTPNEKISSLPNSDGNVSAGLDLKDFIERLDIRLKADKDILRLEETLSLFEESFADAENSRDTVKIQLVATTKRGRHIRLNCIITEPNHMIVTARDMSDYIQYQDLFNASMQAANAGFWSVDFSTGKFTYSDSVLERLTEAEIKLINATGVWAIIHPEDQPAIFQDWQKIFKADDSFSFKYRVKTELGGLMWQRSIGLIERNADGKPLIATAFVMDITSEVESQERLIQEQETSRAKSDFLARMSHEIRTPLNAIIGMSDSLHDEDLSPDIRGVVTDIEEAAEGLNGLLSRTLDHAKLMSNKVQINPEDTDPKALLETCQRLWRPQISAKGLNFKVAIDPNLSDTLCLDEFRIQQCVNNLLSNAIKFTSKGTITLIMKMAQMGGKERLIIAVKDEGIGMSPDVTARIFDDFTQADESISREFGGTGLGMSITKQLCELMGGKIHVKSEKGAGSTFVLLLPADMRATLAAQKNIPSRPAAIERSYISSESNLADKSDNESENQLGNNSPDTHVQPKPNSQRMTDIIIEPVAAPIGTDMDHEAQSSDACIGVPAGFDVPEEVNIDLTAATPFSGLNVLCVEDNSVNQKVVKRLIGKRVKQIHFAENGREALKILNTAPIDIVLMDIHMPIMDGIETTLKIRRSNSAYANVIIIALTADPDYQQKRICKNIGMDDTIGKPVRREDILKAFGRNMGRLPQSFGQKVKLSA